MYLVYIYSSFILNVFLTFFYFYDIYLCRYKVQISSWAFVWEDQGVVHVRKDMLKTC